MGIFLPRLRRGNIFRAASSGVVVRSPFSPTNRAKGFVISLPGPTTGGGATASRTAGVKIGTP